MGLAKEFDFELTDHIKGDELRRYITSNVKATLAIENKEASPEARLINKKFLDNEINSETAIKSILKLYGITKAKNKKARCKV